MKIVNREWCVIASSSLLRPRVLRLSCVIIFCITRISRTRRACGYTALDAICWHRARHSNSRLRDRAGHHHRASLDCLVTAYDAAAPLTCVPQHFAARSYGYLFGGKSCESHQASAAAPRAARSLSAAYHKHLGTYADTPLVAANRPSLLAAHNFHLVR